MPNPNMPFGISPEAMDKMLADYKRNRAKKDFALNHDGKTGAYPPIPKWNEIIKIDPGLPSPIEYTLFVGVDIGAIDIDDLSPETRLAVMRRLAVADKFRNEDTPDWRNKMVRVMTALDNAEDIISTMSWIFGPYIEKTGKLGRGLVKGAKGASDTINFINKFLRGPELTRKAKHKYMDDRKMNAKTRVMRNAPKSKAGKWLNDNIGRLFQAAQASESLTGVGLQIGTIYGTLENAFFTDGTTLLTVGELFADRALRDVNFFYPGAQEIVNKRIEENEKKLAEQPVPWIKQLYDWAAVNLNRSSYNAPLAKKIRGFVDIIKDNPYYEIETHGLALAGFSMFAFMAADKLGPALNAVDQQRYALQVEDVPQVWNHISRSIMRGYGIQFNAADEPLGKARAIPRKALKVAAQDGNDFLANNNAWLPKNTDTDTNAFLHSQVISIASLTGGILSTTGVPLGVENTFDEQLAYFALDQAAMPPQNATLAEITAWATAMKAAAGPDIVNWRRGGLSKMNMAYWRAKGRQPAFFNN